MAKPKSKPKPKPVSPSKAMSRVERSLRSLGLSFPETEEAFPWGHRALKVRGKAFAFISTEGGSFSVSMKLPVSSSAALTLPFTQPTEYGLGKKGWVTSRFDKPSQAPADLLCQWLEESYCAVAPKKLAALLKP